MFEEVCSIYSDALDNVGRYVDMETGECIQQMTIREFCLTDRWKPYVVELRNLIAKHGTKAKQMPEYVETKKRLPGATLSGLFGIWEDECTRKDGTRFIAPVSRRETHLQQHTGWLSIDIDLGDHQDVANFENIRMVCKFRPEIALLMRSCSGTGYFGLVRLAYPDRHKEQFKALMKEYAAIGITLDKACSNIGRVRFASWDEPEHIYINERALAYQGIEDQPSIPLPQRRSTPRTYGRLQTDDHTSFWTQKRVQDRLVELVVDSLVARKENVADTYEEWCKAGWALKEHPYGEQLFHALSSVSEKYNEGVSAQKWHQLGQSTTVSYAYLIHIYKDCVGEDAYHALCRRVYSEMSLLR